MKFTIQYPNGREMKGEAEDLNGVRDAMVALQQHTEATDLWAIGENGERIARLQFEWIEDDDPVKRDQSKHVGEDGRLRYSADGSEVFPGPTGVRR